MSSGAGSGLAMHIPGLLYGGGLGLFIGSVSAGWAPFAIVNLVAVLLVIAGQLSARRQGKPAPDSGREAAA